MVVGSPVVDSRAVARERMMRSLSVMLLKGLDSLFVDLLGPSKSNSCGSSEGSVFI